MAAAVRLQTLWWAVGCVVVRSCGNTLCVTGRFNKGGWSVIVCNTVLVTFTK